MPSSYRVKQGDCISSIADQFGWFPDDLWQAPENEGLRATRRNPDSLAPGDVLTIPDKRRKTCTLALDARHRFKRKGVPAKFSVVISDEDDPLADRPYVLTVDGVRSEGVTDPQGLVEAWIPPSSRLATLEVELAPDDTWACEFVLGGLDPVETISGAQGRLSNLGYGCPSSGRLDEPTRVAIAAFQADLGIAVTRELDEPTIAALADNHDR